MIDEIVEIPEEITGETTGKEFYQSKTLWINLIAILAIFIQSYTGYIIPPECQVALLALINSELRLLTCEPII